MKDSANWYYSLHRNEWRKAAEKRKEIFAVEKASFAIIIIIKEAFVRHSLSLSLSLGVSLSVADSIRLSAVAAVTEIWMALNERKNETQMMAKTILRRSSTSQQSAEGPWDKVRKCEEWKKKINKRKIERNSPTRAIYSISVYLANMIFRIRASECVCVPLMCLFMHIYGGGGGDVALYNYTSYIMDEWIRIGYT